MRHYSQLFFLFKRSFGTGNIVQLVESLLGMHTTLGSSPSPADTSWDDIHTPVLLRSGTSVVLGWLWKYSLEDRRI